MSEREARQTRRLEALAPYASTSGRSRGRRYPEPEHPYRSAFERDRDRIIHSRAFRRLEYKTQVFVYDEGDHYRTRMTHTLEVAQIARTIARVLGLNEHLAEAVALAHDLGHTPFGHSGEDALAAEMSGHGGFEHNRQALRVVELLERKSPESTPGSTSPQVREALAKHSTAYDDPAAEGLEDYRDGLRPSLEGQAVELADSIAYDNHDLDDGLRSGLIDPAELADRVELWRRAADIVRERHGAAGPVLEAQEAVRVSINAQVTDVVEETARRIEPSGCSTPEEAKAWPERLVAFSALMESRKTELQTFLMERLYRHPRVAEAARASGIVADLFRAYTAEPKLMPAEHRDRAEGEGLWLAACDYVAGMTDRFARKEHARLCGGDYGV